MSQSLSEILFDSFDICLTRLTLKPPPLTPPLLAFKGVFSFEMVRFLRGTVDREVVGVGDMCDDGKGEAANTLPGVLTLAEAGAE